MRRVSWVIVPIILIILVGSSYALTGSIGPAKFVFNRNSSQGFNEEATITIDNTNEQTVLVNLSKSESLAQYMELEIEAFSLAPGQNREVRFNINIPEGRGDFNGYISAFFSGTSQDSEKENNTNQSVNSNYQSVTVSSEIIIKDDANSSCGDGSCDLDESSKNCPGDCGSSCGDGYCNGDENYENCGEDCESFCGDGLCILNETCSSCEEDCGACEKDGKKKNGGSSGSGSSSSSTYFSAPEENGTGLNESEEGNNSDVPEEENSTIENISNNISENFVETTKNKTDGSGTLSAITGAVIGGVSGGNMIAIIVIVILVGSGIVIAKKKNIFNKKFVFILIFLLLSINLVVATNQSISLLTPKAVFRVNVSEGPQEVGGKIGLQNNLSKNLNISFDISSNLEPIIELEKENITLEEGSEEWINFTINVEEAGNYVGEIISKVPMENNNPLGYATQIVIVAEGGENTAINQNSQNKNPIISGGVSRYIIIFIIILLILSAIFMLIKKSSKEVIKET